MTDMKSEAGTGQADPKNVQDLTQFVSLSTTKY